MGQRDPQKQKEYQEKWRREHPDYQKLNWRKYVVKKSRKPKKIRTLEEIRLIGREASLKYRKNHPQRVMARSIVYRELRAKRIKKAPCFFCGSVKVEAHHNDYAKPLEVVWCCKMHHRNLDKEQNRLRSA